jgi:hypothetical protein
MAIKCVAYILGIGLGFFSTAVLAACEQKSRSEDVILMQCQVVPSEDILKQAGQDACGEDASCNVWFWGGEIVLPQAAPAKDSDLPKALASQALAVWVNDSKSLLQLRKVK